MALSVSLRGLVKDRLVEEEGDGTDLHDVVAGEMEGIVSAYDDHLAEEVVAFAKRQKFLWVIKKKFFLCRFYLPSKICIDGEVKFNIITV